MDRIEDKDATTRFTIKIMKGKGKEVCEQIVQYFKKYWIELVGNQIPKIKKEFVTLMTTVDHAQFLEYWLIDPRMRIPGCDMNVYIPDIEYPVQTSEQGVEKQ